MTSTLVYGDTEAILVDTQFRISDAEKLADRIAAKGRRLKAILVTHPHFDHFYGASVLLRRFPGTPVYASASDIEYIKGDLANTVAQIRARFGAETIPTDILIPQPWPGTHFTVDGSPWTSSRSAGRRGAGAAKQCRLGSFAGRRDRRRHRVQPGAPLARATDADSRKAWQKTLRLVQERNPRIVVAGHKNHPELPDTPDVLAFNGHTSPSSRLPWPRPTTRESSWPR